MRYRSSLPLLRRVAFLSLLVACGSRTGLFDEGESFNVIPNTDGGPSGRGSGEGGSDAEDGGLDDGAIPPIDARPPTDVFRDDCPDADALLVYTITSAFELQSFNPATGQFKLIGTIACPGVGANGPFSMAVDRRGVAYVLFEDLKLYRVSTATGACLGTSYVPRQADFALFGMGFATDRGGPSETLFVSGDESRSTGSANGLARIDPVSFQLTPLASYTPPISRAELTGTGDGRLFAFYRKDPFASDSYIGEVNTVATPGNPVGRIVGERYFPDVDQGEGWAFAFWAGDFYMFHAPENQARVTRWRPSDDTVVQVATSAARIVGAGVSTCAPQQ